MLHARISLVVGTLVVVVEAPAVAAARHVRCIQRRVRTVVMRRVSPSSPVETSPSTVAIATSLVVPAVAVVRVTVDRAGNYYERGESKPWGLLRGRSQEV